MIKPNSYLYKKIRNVIIKLYTFGVRKRFKKLESFISPNIEITNPQFISIGKNNFIRPYVWIFAITKDSTGNNFTPEIKIGDYCSIGRFVHLTCSNRVVIGNKVFITEGVLITDSLHGYKDITKPILDQPLISLGEIQIGDGSWIGNGAKLVGNVVIGENCLVSANAVLTNIIVPDYCVVSGIPGKIVKKYDQEKQEWYTIQ
jgi:acetyltransferase-like isoleucine patch superfamily enzyme